MQKELGIEPHFLFAPMIYGAILTDRNKVGPSTIKDSLKSIKKGKILGIFPEGGITSTVLSSAKPGAILVLFPLRVRFQLQQPQVVLVVSIFFSRRQQV